LEEGLLDAFREDPAVSTKLPELEKAVLEGRRSPTLAAEDLLRQFLGRVRE
jgi:hypothetical protein